MNDDALIEALANKWSVTNGDYEERYYELREEHVRLQKQMIHLSEERDELFSLVDDMFSCRGSEKYAEAAHAVKEYMLKNGWCFECGGFGCECED